MDSVKQVAANQRNAQLSTGPRSEEGKAVVSKNAIKHGIFAKDLVISRGDGHEEAGEYFELFNELVGDLKPVGRMESLLVEKIAVDYWRLRRLIRYETGRIRCLMDDYKDEALNRYYDRGDCNDYLGIGRFSKPVLKYFDLKDDVREEEVRQARLRMRELEDDGDKLMAEEGFIKFVLRKKLKREVAAVSAAEVEAVHECLKGLSQRQFGKLREAFLEVEDEKIEEMEEVSFWQVRFERLGRIYAIPDNKELEKVCKYETSLERSIHRNLNALRELQGRRE